MTTIIVKLLASLSLGDRCRYEKEIAEIINRQRKTGVIVLPNYVSYEGTVDDANPCDTCEIAKYTNLEDDDTPCQNCGEDDNADETL